MSGVGPDHAPRTRMGRGGGSHVDDQLVLVDDTWCWNLGGRLLPVIAGADDDDGGDGDSVPDDHDPAQPGDGGDDTSDDADDSSDGDGNQPVARGDLNRLFEQFNRDTDRRVQQAVSTA